MTKVIYSANFLNKENKDRLKDLFPPVHVNIYYDHSTIMYMPRNYDLINPGTKRRLFAWGRLTTDKVDVLLVDDDSSFNKFPHITLSTAEGVSPATSNREIELNFEKIERFRTEIPINAIEGYFANGRIFKTELQVI